MNALDALGQQAGRLGAAEDALCAGAKRLNDCDYAAEKETGFTAAEIPPGLETDSFVSLPVGLEGLRHPKRKPLLSSRDFDTATRLFVAASHQGSTSSLKTPLPALRFPSDCSARSGREGVELSRTACRPARRRRREDVSRTLRK